MSLITRTAKGSKLTISEMDGNLLYLSESIASGGGGGGSAFPFTGSAEISGSIVINSQLTLGVGSGVDEKGGPTRNVALGYNNLQYNTTGARNVALGFQALQSNTTGNYNVALGIRALRYNTTGTQNVALGLLALQSNTTGNQNVALGPSAL
jgi:trimeric autotransporter adhesin